MQIVETSRLTIQRIIEKKMDEDRIARRLDKIQQFLDKSGYVSGCPFKSAVTAIRFLQTIDCINAEWSGDEAAQLASLRAALKSTLTPLEHRVSADPECSSREQTVDSVQVCSTTIHELCCSVRKFYGKLMEVPHPPFRDHVVFDEFAASVRDYVLSFREEVVFWNGYVSGGYAREYSSALGYCKATEQKLECFRCLIRRFSEQCGDWKKLQAVLARAGGVTLSVLSVANDRTKLFTPDPSIKSLSASSEMSRRLSSRNIDVTEVVRGVMEAAIMRASEEPAHLMWCEEMKEKFSCLLRDAQTQFCILDVPDFALKGRVFMIFNSDVEMLKQRYAELAGDAVSLCSSIQNHAVLLKLQHKLDLIKAEIFVLELCNQKANLNFVEKRLAAIRRAFGFLSEFFEKPHVHMEDMEKLMVSLIVAFLREAGSLCDVNISEEKILETSLAIFKVFKAEAMFMVLTYDTSSLKFLAAFHVEMLHKSLIVLRVLLSGPPLEDENLSKICEILASKAADLVCSFGERNKVMNQSLEISLFSLQLSTKFEINFEGITAEYQKVPWLSNSFPMSDGPIFADHLLGKLWKFVTDKPNNIAVMKNQVEALLGDLEFLRSYLQDVKNIDLGLRLTCLIYDAEYIIGMLTLGDSPTWYHHLFLWVAIQETKFIKSQILEYVHGNESLESSFLDAQLTSTYLTREGNNLSTEEVVVGFDDQTKIIVAQLLNASKNLQVVSLVGMAGIGKTTLARKVYSSLPIRHHFAVCAMCSVSQVYQKREILLDILGDFVEVTDDMKKKDDNDLALIVKRKLKGRRYLVVIDDIWRIEHWNDLRQSFPDDDKGSRILFTTRLHNVALEADPKREPHVLPLLSPEQSWDLLQAKVFNGGGCPKQLFGVGSRIVKNCKGLPLAIVVVAGILKRTERKKDQWEAIAEHLRSLIADDQESHFTDILEFSYNHLPSYLKPCYLYLGSFLEDQEIPVKKLQWLWIAEGFIPEKNSVSLEETAEDFFVELINRSLVMKATRRSLGGTKTCRIHDMLRDLCLNKAKEENFMQLISTNDTNSDFLLAGQYRLCVHSPKQNFIQSRPYASHLHSLLFFATSNSEQRNSYDVSFVFQSFKLLRVLELESINAWVKTQTLEIDWMLGLTYLAIKGNVKLVPSSIAKLWNLEILIVKGTRGEIVLPSTLWSMVTLRHVQVRPRASLTLSSPELENAMVLESLTTFSSPAFSVVTEEAGNILIKRWMGLKKLRCIFLDPYIFTAVESLTQLESLNVHYSGWALPSNLGLPQNLKKLTLSKFCFPWEYMLVISRLSNLKVLKLLFKALEGETWEMTVEEVFPKLECLILENLNFSYWTSSLGCSDHFPELQRFVLRSCKKLVEVPSSFGLSEPLEMIEVHSCSQSATYSAKEIIDLKLEYGFEDFKVMITPTEWDFRRSSSLNDG